MKRVGYTYWREEDMWIGYLEEFPEYRTQGVDLEELQENLKDLFHDLSNDLILGVRHHAD